MAKRSSKGRQKIEMKKILKPEQLQVTFSKRRLGVFNQANQICIRTGAQVAIVVFSPTNRAFPFGSPDLKSIIDMYQQQSLQPHSSRCHQELLHLAQTNEERLNGELSVLETKINAEKRRQKWLDQNIEERRSKYWWEAPIEELDLNQLEELLRAMQGLYNDITKEIQKISSYYHSNHALLNGEAYATNGFVNNCRYISNQMASFYARAPATMNFCQNVSNIPSIVSGSSSLPMVLPQFDLRASGMNDLMNNAGSLTTGLNSQMIPETSGVNNPMVPFNQIG